MAQVESNSPSLGGSLPVPSPDAVIIESQNARRLARRRQAAALALQIGQTSAEDLDRAGDQRQVGGTFETLQAVPEPQPLSSPGLNIQDILAFLQVLSFAPQEEILGQQEFFSSFGPGVLGLNTSGANP
jgi:hypothetical protein